MNWLLKRLARYGYARLCEASTWRNIILLCGGSWSAAHPDQAALIVPVAISLAGFVGSFFPDLLGATTLEARLDTTSPDAPLPPIDLQGRSESSDAPVVRDAGPAVGRVRALPPVDQPADRTDGDDTQPNYSGNGWGDK